MAAEHKRITINTQIGAIKLDEQVKVEMLVSRSKISRHHPNRYPLMAVLESGVTMVELVKVLMVVERMESKVEPLNPVDDHPHEHQPVHPECLGSSRQGVKQQQYKILCQFHHRP